MQFFLISKKNKEIHQQKMELYYLAHHTQTTESQIGASNFAVCQTHPFSTYFFKYMPLIRKQNKGQNVFFLATYMVMNFSSGKI